ncbi:hypothetical protein FHG87_018694 [Trinorchestia longiramus]|nr:hypothetical protein FHG87_018694 [Trinorchestia longiramus]
MQSLLRVTATCLLVTFTLAETEFVSVEAPGEFAAIDHIWMPKTRASTRPADYANFEDFDATTDDPSDDWNLDFGSIEAIDVTKEEGTFARRKGNERSSRQRDTREKRSTSNRQDARVTEGDKSQGTLARDGNGSSVHANKQDYTDTEVDQFKSEVEDESVEMKLSSGEEEQEEKEDAENDQDMGINKMNIGGPKKNRAGNARSLGWPVNDEELVSDIREGEEKNDDMRASGSTIFEKNVAPFLDFFFPSKRRLVGPLKQCPSGKICRRLSGQKPKEKHLRLKRPKKMKESNFKKYPSPHAGHGLKTGWGLPKGHHQGPTGTTQKTHFKILDESNTRDSGSNSHFSIQSINKQMGHHFDMAGSGKRVRTMKKQTSFRNQKKGRDSTELRQVFRPAKQSDKITGIELGRPDELVTDPNIADDHAIILTKPWDNDPPHFIRIPVEYSTDPPPVLVLKEQLPSTAKAGKQHGKGKDQANMAGKFPEIEVPLKWPPKQQRPFGADGKSQGFSPPKTDDIVKEKQRQKALQASDDRQRYVQPTSAPVQKEVTSIDSIQAVYPIKIIVDDDRKFSEEMVNDKHRLPRPEDEGLHLVEESGSVEFDVQGKKQETELRENFIESVFKSSEKTSQENKRLKDIDFLRKLPDFPQLTSVENQLKNAPVNSFSSSGGSFRSPPPSGQNFIPIHNPQTHKDPKKVMNGERKINNIIIGRPRANDELNMPLPPENLFSVNHISHSSHQNNVPINRVTAPPLLNQSPGDNRPQSERVSSYTSIDAPVFRFSSPRKTSNQKNSTANFIDNPRNKNMRLRFNDFTEGTTDDNHRLRFSRLTEESKGGGEGRFDLRGVQGEHDEMRVRDPTAITLKSPQFSLSVQFAPTVIPGQRGHLQTAAPEPPPGIGFVSSEKFRNLADDFVPSFGPPRSSFPSSRTGQTNEFVGRNPQQEDVRTDHTFFTTQSNNRLSHNDLTPPISRDRIRQQPIQDPFNRNRSFIHAFDLPPDFFDLHNLPDSSTFTDARENRFGSNFKSEIKFPGPSLHPSLERGREKQTSDGRLSSNRVYASPDIRSIRSSITGGFRHLKPSGNSNQGLADADTFLVYSSSLGLSRRF